MWKTVSLSQCYVTFDKAVMRLNNLELKTNPFTVVEAEEVRDIGEMLQSLCEHDDYVQTRHHLLTYNIRRYFNQMNRIPEPLFGDILYALVTKFELLMVPYDEARKQVKYLA